MRNAWKELQERVKARHEPIAKFLSTGYGVRLQNKDAQIANRIMLRFLDMGYICLAAAKARGVKLGNPNGARALRGKQTGNAEAVARIKERAAQRAMNLQGIVEGIKRSGITSVRGVTEELNRQGTNASRGGEWHPTAVARLLSRLANHNLSTASRVNAVTQL